MWMICRNSLQMSRKHENWKYLRIRSFNLYLMRKMKFLCYSILFTQISSTRTSNHNTNLIVMWRGKAFLFLCCYLSCKSKRAFSIRYIDDVTNRAQYSYAICHDKIESSCELSCFLFFDGRRRKKLWNFSSKFIFTLTNNTTNLSSEFIFIEEKFKWSLFLCLCCIFFNRELKWNCNWRLRNSPLE
jgi:hypothetical protein